MTAELREAIALAPWGPVTVKKEEEEEENFLGQASSQQVPSENIKVWAPGEGPQTGLDVSEQEEKGPNMFWDMAMVLKATKEVPAASSLGIYSLPGTLAKSEIMETYGNMASLVAETKNPQLLVPKTEICDETEKPFIISGRIQKVDPQGPEFGEACEKGNIKRQRIKREKRDFRQVTVKDCHVPESFKEEEDQKYQKSGEIYSLSSGSIKNQKSQTGQKPFTCSVCGKGFSQSANLVVHQRIHTGEKPFECHECGKAFIQSANLVVHQRIHTGQKPYVCSKCGKAFTQSSNLTVHQKIHSLEKTFKCSECEKAFSYSSQLARHQKVHITEKCYECNECGKTFTRSSNLIVHQRIHTGEKPFACNDCGKAFTQSANLIVHQRSHTVQSYWNMKTFKRLRKLAKHVQLLSLVKIIQTQEINRSQKATAGEARLGPKLVASARLDFETNIKKMDLILEQVNLREFSGRIQGPPPEPGSWR
ncbi:Zinc finger protein 35 [Manis javanica]|nr:Zinc finger protein 35 [Manis javanica]